MRDQTSCYYDSVIVQWDSSAWERTKKGWKVQRYRHSPEYFRTQEEAYTRASQMYVEARLEYDRDVVVEGGTDRGVHDPVADVMYKMMLRDVIEAANK